MKCFIETIILCGFIFLVMKPVNGQTLSQKKIDIEFEKYEYANKNKDYIRMVEILKPLAKQGHTKSQAKLGVFKISSEFLISSIGTFFDLNKSGWCFLTNCL
jgi:hypothetical protein